MDGRGTSFRRQQRYVAALEGPPRRGRLALQRLHRFTSASWGAEGLEREWNVVATAEVATAQNSQTPNARPPLRRLRLHRRAARVGRVGVRLQRSRRRRPRGAPRSLPLSRRRLLREGVQQKRRWNHAVAGVLFQSFLTRGTTSRRWVTRGVARILLARPAAMGTAMWPAARMTGVVSTRSHGHGERGLPLPLPLQQRRTASTIPLNLPVVGGTGSRLSSAFQHGRTMLWYPRRRMARKEARDGAMAGWGASPTTLTERRRGYV